ncbi:methyl-accepting chemotaxis protein [Agarivorans gilvus]|nr:methyl-accepting chemotaxis protein [Agarivorans gilvus]
MHRLWGRFSIAARLYLTMVIVGLSLLAITLTYTYQHEKTLVEEMAKQQIKVMSESYFEGLNTLMLSGAMANKKLLHDKMLKQDNILDINLLPSAPIQAMFRPNSPAANLSPDQQQAFSGDTVYRYKQQQNQAALQVLTPIIMSDDHNGVNCLTCHVTSKNGDVAAIIDVSFSLNKANAMIHRALINQASLLFAVFFVGMLMLALIFRGAVAKRLSRLRKHLNQAADNADLSIDFSDPYNDEIGALYRSLNSLISSFKTSLSQLTQSSSDLYNTAERVKDVASSTEHSVSQLKSGTASVATTMLQIEASSNEVKKNAQFTTERTQNADKQVKSGADKAQQTLNYMQALVNIVDQANSNLQELGERSEKVNVMVESISAIAEQTNLLALNAAIEAARTGEQGRGFAVVADEVRSLATRTHQSTDEIKAINEQLNQQKNRMIDTMKQAGEAVHQSSNNIDELWSILQQIAQQSEEITELNSQMALASEQQNEAVVEVNAHITNIQSIAETTARDASEDNIISERVVALATELKNMVNSYKL